MYIEEAIVSYTGRTDLIAGTDYILQNDGAGVYIKQWNVVGASKPTMEQLQAISDSLAPAMGFQAIKDLAIAKQIEAQSVPALLLGKYNLDYTDGTVSLLEGARTILDGTNTTTIEVIDYKGIPALMTLDELNQMLGSKVPLVEGVIAVRRKDLHTQMIEILKKALSGQEYAIEYN